MSHSSVPATQGKVVPPPPSSPKPQTTTHTLGASGSPAASSTASHVSELNASVELHVLFGRLSLKSSQAHNVSPALVCPNGMSPASAHLQDAAAGTTLTETSPAQPEAGSCREDGHVHLLVQPAGVLLESHFVFASLCP